MKNRIQRYWQIGLVIALAGFGKPALAQMTQLQINGLRQFYSAPYLLDFTFSLRDQDNHAVILNPSQFTVVCKEDGVAISASETGFRLLSGDNKQLKGFLVLDYTMSMIDPEINGDSDGDYVADSVEAMEAGAKGIIGAIHGDAQLGLFEFHRADAGFPPAKIADLTVDKAYLTNQIGQIYTNVMWTSGSTRCWDALYLALSEFPNSNPADDQRFIVFLSDGKDESSTHTDGEVIAMAQAKGVHIFCIGYGVELIPAKLQSITAQTGGQYYPAASAAEMTQRFEQIGIDLGGQYILRWATLKRSSSSFTPSFELTYSGVKATATANSYNPSSYQGNELQGHLSFDSSLSQSRVATLVLRAAYIPRAVTRIRLSFATAWPFTVERIPYGEGGVCPTNWTFTVNQTNGIGYLELASPAPANPFSALPFATLGKLVKFQFQGITNLAQCFYDLSIDNSVYASGGASFVMDNADAVMSPLTSLPHCTPVSWMNRYGFTNGLVLAELADPDGDGVPTWREYQTGTNPTNKNSAFLITDLQLGNQVTITFNTESKWIYQVDRADTLNQWQALRQEIPGTGNPTNIVDPDSTYSQQPRFYRLSATKPWEPDLDQFAWIAPGTFVMGSPNSEQGRWDDEGPQTTVTLTQGFWMGRTEVTQAEYQAVMGSNPSHFTGDLQRPVEQVSWNDATDYCGKRTQQERQAGKIPAGYEYRLPTEAEWEYACRAGTTTRFYWGNDSGYSQIGLYAWYWDNSGDTTHPVKQKSPNAWGLYDMSGNVREWCLDWYGTYPGGSVTDPKGATSGSDRVLRGGSWYGDGRFCRSANRLDFTAVYQFYYYGFRLVLAPGP